MNSTPLYNLNDFEILKMHWLDPVIRKTTFQIMNTLTQGFRRASANTGDNLHFYLKGGNATTILGQHYFGTPLSSFPSDFDFALVMNPTLPLDTYNRIQHLAVKSVIDILVYLLQKQYPIKNASATKPLTEFQAVDGLVVPVNKSLSEYFEQLQTTSVPKVNTSCPFDIYIRPNIIYRHIPQDIGTITLRVHLHDQIHDLVDISFFLRRDEIASQSLLRDWNMTTIMQYKYPSDSRIPELDIDVYEPISAYVNHFIAHQKNTRPEKQKARKRRMNTLKHMIQYIPAVNRNTRKRKITNALRTNTNNIRRVVNTI
jgi:hypothetical protein